MIKLDMDSNGSINIGQQVTNPSIYFDNWALMDIGCGENGADKFIKVLKESNGTLNFSGMNLLELSLISNKKQINSIESFLDKVMPNLFFIDIIPQNVIDRENRIITKGEQIAPHMDVALLKFFGGMHRNATNPLSVKGFFRHLRQKEIIEGCKTFMEGFADMVQQKREIIKNNQKYKDMVSKIPSGKQIQRATRYIYQDVINSIIRDNIDMTNLNNWRDFFHTIVPVAYCDLVLLDKTWEHKANESIERIRRGGQSAEIAKVFSEKNMDKFWKNLEGFTKYKE